MGCSSSHGNAGGSCTAARLTRSPGRLARPFSLRVEVRVPRQASTAAGEARSALYSDSELNVGRHPAGCEVGSPGSRRRTPVTERLRRLELRRAETWRARAGSESAPTPAAPGVHRPSARARPSRRTGRRRRRCWRAGGLSTASWRCSAIGNLDEPRIRIGPSLPGFFFDLYRRAPNRAFGGPFRPKGFYRRLAWLLRGRYTSRR